MPTSKIIDQNMNADQKDPHGQNDNTPTYIVAADQKEQRKPVAQNSHPAWCNASVDHNGRRRNHEYGCHFDRIDIHDDISCGAGETKSRGVDELARVGGGGHQDNSTDYRG